MGGDFAFFLPVMFILFAAAFAILWQRGERKALLWSLGFFGSGLGFTMPAVDLFVQEPRLAVIADVLFGTAFLLFGQAMLDRYGRPGWAFGPRIAIWLASIMGTTAAVLVYGNTVGEVVISDAACTLLLAPALCAVARRGGQRIDQALFGIAGLVCVDNVVRGTTAFLTVPVSGGAAFLASDYAFLMQASGTVLGFLLGMTALAATGFDIVGRYREAASIDPLSRLLNRRGFEQAAASLDPAARLRGSVVVCDIDHFKRINDAHGHGVGDKVILAFATILRSLLPAGAIAARFGGEEFVVYLPHEEGAEPMRFANRLRGAFADQDWSGAGIRTRVTASFGVAGVQDAEDWIGQTIALADQALYEAKRAGRNRVSARLTVIAASASLSGDACASPSPLEACAS